MQTAETDILIADRLEGLLQPYENGFFCGQDRAEQRFLSGAQSGRLHHAWLLSGPSGVGKASFAFRIARALVESADQHKTIDGEALRVLSDPGHPVFRRVASGGHPNILHLRVPYDDKTKRFKTQLTVEEVRRSVGFFGTTAGESGWRIAVVDSADDMTISAANALLKILEEPPEKTLFFILSSQPGRLLPTIRSRCQKLEFDRLDATDLFRALDAASIQPIGDVSTLEPHSALLNGSVRRGFQFLENNMSVLVENFHALMDMKPSYDMSALHGFADQVAARGSDEKYDFFIHLIEDFASNLIRRDQPNEALVSVAEVWEKMRERIDLEARMNLDRKQTVLALFHDVGTLS